jgi:hypothetical protein
VIHTRKIIDHLLLTTNCYLLTADSLSVFCVYPPLRAAYFCFICFFAFYAMHNAFLLFLNLSLNLNPPQAGKPERSALCALRIMMPLAVP